VALFGFGKSAKQPDDVEAVAPAPTPHELETVREIDRQVIESDLFFSAPIQFNGERTSLYDQCEFGRRRVIGDHHDTQARRGRYNGTINRDQMAVIGTVAAELQTIPRPLVRSDDGIDETLYVVSHEVMEELGDGVSNIIGDYEDEVLSGDVFVTADGKRALMDGLTIPDAATVGPDGVAQARNPLLAEDDFRVVTDEKAIEIGQGEIDYLWENACGDGVLVQAVFHALACGWQDVVLTLDYKAQKMRLILPDPSLVRCSPEALSLWHADFKSFDQVMGLDEAKALLGTDGDRAALLAEAKQTGNINSELQSQTVGSSSLRIDQDASGNIYGVYAVGGANGAYANADFQRDMVVIRTAWVRADYPMRRAEAMAENLVAEVDATSASAMAGGAVVEMYGESGEFVGFAASESGEPVDEGGAGWPSMWVLTDDAGDPTDEECTPPGDGDEYEDGKGASDNWPTVRHWRQIVMLPRTHRVLDDMRCPFLYPPIERIINIPWLRTPYGIAEPQRTKDVTDGINDLFGILRTHYKHWRNPQEVLSTAMKAMMDRSPGNEWYSAPDFQWVMPDEQWVVFMQSGGKIAVEQPRMDSSVMGWMNLLLAEHDRLSGRQDVLQGASPGANMSARAIDALTQQAMGPIGLRSRFLEDSLKRIALNMADLALGRGLLRERTVRLHNAGVERGVIRAARSMWKRLKFVVDVDITASKAIRDEREREMAVELRKSKEISHLQLLEALGRDDPEGEHEDWMKEQIEDGRLMMLSQSQPNLSWDELKKLAESATDGNSALQTPATMMAGAVPGESLVGQPQPVA
jgi:hypothetical protein